MSASPDIPSARVAQTVALILATPPMLMGGALLFALLGALGLALMAAAVVDVRCRPPRKGRRQGAARKDLQAS